MDWEGLTPFTTSLTTCNRINDLKGALGLLDNENSAISYNQLYTTVIQPPFFCTIHCTDFALFSFHFEKMSSYETYTY